MRSLLPTIFLVTACCGCGSSSFSSAPPVKIEGPHVAINVTDATFESVVLNSDQPVLVDFWAEWCPPCLELAPTVEVVARELEGKVVVAKLNVDEGQRESARYAVDGIPALLLFKDGKEVGRMVGGGSREELIEFVLTRM